ncbi:hypothetical protein L964_1514 [Leuconostoc pseudomesenteroides 1159]|nr:hypothetical protein L964_1514 [Leuconostoc pseudomesenteroides 1159]
MIFSRHGIIVTDFIIKKLHKTVKSQITTMISFSLIAGY